MKNTDIKKVLEKEFKFYFKNYLEAAHRDETNNDEDYSEIYAEARQIAFKELSAVQHTIKKIVGNKNLCKWRNEVEDNFIKTLENE